MLPLPLVANSLSCLRLVTRASAVQDCELTGARQGKLLQRKVQGSQLPYLARQDRTDRPLPLRKALKVCVVLFG